MTARAPAAERFEREQGRGNIFFIAIAVFAMSWFIAALVSGAGQ